MHKIKHLFFDKVQCIYNNISQNNLNEFTNLFYIRENKASFENRKSYLSKRWLKKDNKALYPRMFKSEYFKYKFSKLTLNGRQLFDDAHEFLEMDIEPFCKRIKSYTQQQVELKIDKDSYYNYMYVFNINGMEDNYNIDYYEMEYLGSSMPNEIDIRINPPKHKSLIEIAPYIGKIKYQGNKIILSFENSDDYISAIFNTDLINNHSKYLVGVGIGIADINQKIPVAKKVVLSKERINNIDELYLTLNESEILTADENLYKLRYDRDSDMSHFEKYASKIDRVHRLFSTLSEQKKFNDFYYQLGFKEFSAINHIFQKLTQKHPYHINYRKRVLDILLKSYAHEQYKKLYIVIPIYQGDNIFEHQSPQAIELQDELQQLSTKVEIEIIFIIRSCQKSFTYEFMSFLERIKEQTKIYFALKKNIEDRVNSIDFFFTNKDNFVVTKFLRVNSSVFNLFKDISTIDEHKAIYKKILNRSLNYEDFFNKNETLCQSYNPILENLIGKWYLHMYGTQKFWIDEVSISSNGVVTLINENGSREIGEIIHKSNQSIILLEDIKTKQLLTITFDHFSYKTTRTFVVKVLAKQFSSDLDVFSIGILSRHQIEIGSVQAILGDVDEVRTMEKDTIQKRLSEYLVGKFYF